MTFTGTTVTLIGFRGPATGIVRVYLDGSFHSTVDTFSPTEIQAPIFTDTNLAPGSHELTVEVSGTKNAAASGFTLVVDAFDVRSRFEELDAVGVYTGTWTANFDDAYSGTSANYGSGSAARSVTAGSRATFSFSGSSVTWIGYRRRLPGLPACIWTACSWPTSIPMPRRSRLRRRSSAPRTLPPAPTRWPSRSPGRRTPRRRIRSSSWMRSTSRCRHRRRSSGVSSRPTRTYPAGVWQTSSANLLYTGGTMAHSTTAGSRAEFTFTGTSVRWIGQRLFDGGIARVFVDGVAVADVDTYAPVQEEYQAAMFSAAGLAPGSHTLRIEVTGSKNAASQGTRIVVDAFDISQ